MDNKTPPIAEKVNFWEEQDKINNALILRLLADHKLIVSVSQEVASLSASLSNLTAGVQSTQQTIIKQTDSLSKATNSIQGLQNKSQLVEYTI